MTAGVTNKKLVKVKFLVLSFLNLRQNSFPAFFDNLFYYLKEKSSKCVTVISLSRNLTCCVTIRYSSFIFSSSFFSHFTFFTDLIEERMWAYSSHPSRITATQQERLNSKRNSK